MKERTVGVTVSFFIQ